MLRPHCVLPDEIIERIVKQLDSIRDIYAFVQTSRHHYNLLRKYMYRHNIRYSSSSALLYAVDNGDEELVRQMIENKTGLSVLHENERIPERISARGGYPSTLSVMPKSASNTEAPWVVAYVSSPLAVAAGDGKALIVKMLLDSNHIRRDPLFRYETTEALTWVARHGHYEMVKMFLAYDVIDPNFPDRNGCPPLTHAVMGRHRDIVELLLADRRVNPDLHDLEGRTPLSYAAEAGDCIIAKMLLETGRVNIRSVDRIGRTPCSYAMVEGHTGMVDLLKFFAFAARVLNRYSTELEPIEIFIMNKFISFTKGVLNWCDGI